MRSALSVVVPARNEQRHIDACVRSILAQEVDADVEVVVLDGASTDDTAALARGAGARVVDNPEATIPSALNRGLGLAGGEWLARFYAHGEMPAGYLAACLAALAEETGAGNVGGWCLPEPEGPWGRAAAAALASPVGVGNARRWRRPAADDHRRDVDSVPFGCYPTALLRELGGWRPDLFANEDFELNWRVRRAGRRVVFDPAIWSVYRPRESLGGVATQYWRYGKGKAAMLRTAPGSLRPRQVLPPALVATVAVSPLPWLPGVAARAALAGYGIVLAGVGVTSKGGWRTAPVLASMHLAWGTAFLWGTIERSWTSQARPSS